MPQLRRDARLAKLRELSQLAQRQPRAALRRAEQDIAQHFALTRHKRPYRTYSSASPHRSILLAAPFGPSIPRRAIFRTDRVTREALRLRCLLFFFFRRSIRILIVAATRAAQAEGLAILASLLVRFVVQGDVLHNSQASQYQLPLPRFAHISTVPATSVSP